MLVRFRTPWIYLPIFAASALCTITNLTIPLITLEEHCVSPSVQDWYTSHFPAQFQANPTLLGTLLDVDQGRLESMDRGGVAVQVLSHAPGLCTAPLDICRQANNDIYTATQRHPGRYAGFAVLPMGEPQQAADELRRCVQKLGFKGALIDNHFNGKYYEGKAYRVLWKTLQELDVPLYLHPTFPAPDVQGLQYQGEISSVAVTSLGTTAWGWHSDTGLHILKLFASGLFDELPGLKIAIGHFGEMIPYMLERVENLSKRWGNFSRPFSEVWAENLWITTSGFWSINPLKTILGNTAVDRVLYSVDYPFATNEGGLQFMQTLKQSGLVTPEQFEMIGCRNAEKLLKISVCGRRRKYA